MPARPDFDVVGVSLDLGDGFSTTLTIDFDNWDSYERHHYAFKVSEAEFDGIFDRVRAEGLTYGSGPRAAENMEINHRNGGRGFYFRDPNGHLLEVLTA